MSTKVLVQVQNAQAEVYDISAKAENVIINNNTTLANYITTNNNNISQINTNYANLIKTKVPDAITSSVTQLKAVAVEGQDYYVLQLSNDNSSWTRDIYVPKISNQQIDALFGSN